MSFTTFLKLTFALSAAIGLGILLLVPDPFALIGWVSDRGRDVVESAIPDKVQHAFAYSVLTLVLILVFEGDRRRRLKWAAGLAFAHGAVTEFLQLFIPNRHCDWQDLLANSAGIAVMAAFTGLFLGTAPVMESSPTGSAT